MLNPNFPDVLVWSPQYSTDLSKFGVDKPFALDRGQLVLNALEKDLGRPAHYVEPSIMEIDDLLLVHGQKYLDTLAHSQTWCEIFELKENEYSPEKAICQLSEIYDDIRLKCGGTKLAGQLALTHGLAANLGGGYHHAFADQGHGFCALNDIAVTIRYLQKKNLCRKVLIVDLDFHQGDGNARIFKNDPDVFTLSVHSEEGWPEEKETSSLDIPIFSRETKDYQQKMEAGVHKALSVFAPDLVIYVAGSDPYELDVLPGTKFIQLTLDEMRKRDEFVIDTFAKRGIPLAMVFAGGYGPHVWECHYYAVRRLLENVASTATGFCL